MGDWTIVIHGTGCHHNNDPKIDVDLLLPDLCKQLRNQGQSLASATITTGGRQKVDVSA